MGNKKILKEKDVFPFGKYKGCVIEEIFKTKEGVSYCWWFMKNIEGYEFELKFTNLIYKEYSRYFMKESSKKSYDSIHMGSHGNEWASENGYMEHF
jgi:hypothetical protein